MKMVKAFIRAEKEEEVLNTLMEKGFSAVTKASVLGRGKQKGLKVGDIYYDEIPKTMIMVVVEDINEEKIVKLITEKARTDKGGRYGDGKIFISEVDKCITISSGQAEL